MPQNRTTHPRRLFVAGIFGLTMGCGKDAADSGGGGNVETETPDTYDGPPVSFEEALTEVLIPSCGFNSCHGSGAGYLRIHERQTQQEWLDMSSNILPTRRMIIPGDSSQSYLIKKMENSSDIAGEGMPPPTGGLSGYRIGLVRSWIDNIDAD